MNCKRDWRHDVGSAGRCRTRDLYTRDAPAAVPPFVPAKGGPGGPRGGPVARIVIARVAERRHNTRKVTEEEERDDQRRTPSSQDSRSKLLTFVPVVMIFVSAGASSWYGVREYRDSRCCLPPKSRRCTDELWSLPSTAVPRHSRSLFACAPPTAAREPMREPAKESVLPFELLPAA